MKRFRRIAIPSFILGFLFGMVFWYTASPLWIDNVVSEELAVADSSDVVATGSFVDADALHKGSGMVTVINRAGGSNEIQFTDFQVTNGPDLEVWLTAHPNPTSSDDVKGAAWLSLGRLKGNIGDQAYRIPDGTNLDDYKAVVIWCEQFGVLFSPAVLSRP